jgi:type IV secretory pathway VirB10-like protein
MPTTPNAQLTKLAIGIASVAAVAGLAGRFAPNNPAPAPEADPAAAETLPAQVPATQVQPRPSQTAQVPTGQTAAPRTQVAQAPAATTQPTQKQLEQQREAEKQRQDLAKEHGEREHEHEDEDEWEEEDDEAWEHGGSGLLFWTQPAQQQSVPVDPATMPSYTDAAGQQWVQVDPGQAYIAVNPDGTVPVPQQPVTRTRSKHS